MRTLTPLLLLFFSTLLYAQPPHEGYVLDGVNDFIDVPGTSNINSTVTNNRSYEFYFKVNSTAARQMIFEEGGGTRATLAYVQNGFLVLGAYNRADYTPNWQGTFFREPVVADTWYHVALVLDNGQPTVNNPIGVNDNTALKWYLNGTLMDQRAGFQFGTHNALIIGVKDGSLRFPNCGTWTAGGSSEYCFGSLTNDGGSNEYYMDGNIYGFRIWNDVRTATEIVDNMDAVITTVGQDDLVASLDGDTLTYLDNSDTPVDVSGSNVTTISWKATAATTDWNTATNWVGDTVPDATLIESVNIPTSSNYPVLNSQIIVGRLDVDSGASITVNAGATLDVRYALTNDGTITIENDGSLLYRESKAIAGSGNFIVKRDSPDNSNQFFFNYWSTPLADGDESIATVFPGSVNHSFFYNASTNPSDWNFYSGAMNAGLGYAVRANQTGVRTATFDGKVNNGDVVEPVYYHPDFNNPSDIGFNILGNPYPSAIDWELFAADNTDAIEGTVYFWNQSVVTAGDNLASDYIAYNSTGSNPPGATKDIGTAQGFVVQAKSGGTGSVTFKNSHRLAGNNTQFFRNAVSNNNDGRVWLRMSGNNYYSTILVGFLPGATDAYDPGFDGAFIGEGATIEFYSYLNTQKLAIQALPELTTTDRQIALGAEVLSANNYTIAIDQEFVNPDFDIVLEDTDQGTFTDLRMGGYTFNVSSAQEMNDRFILHLNYNQVLSVDDFDPTSETLLSYFKGNELLFDTNLTDLKWITLFDIQGRRIQATPYNGRIAVPATLPAGVYVVSLTRFSGKTIVKKVLKQ